MKVIFSTHRKKQICALIICRQCNGERIIVHTETGSILLIGQYDSGGVLSCWQPPSWNWGRPVLGKNIQITLANLVMPVKIITVTVKSLKCYTERSEIRYQMLQMSHVFTKDLGLLEEEEGGVLTTFKV